MKFKSMTPVNNNYAVLATSKKHYHELCYDRKLDDRQFFWAVLDGGDECHRRFLGPRFFFLRPVK